MARKSAAIDVSVLLALAAGEEIAQEVIDWLLKSNIFPIVTPTVLQELELARDEGEGVDREYAPIAIANMATWGFYAPQLTSVEHGYAEANGRRLIAKVLDGAAQDNDGLILAEAAILESELLVTYRECLLQCSNDRLRLCFLEGDLFDTFVVSPDDILDYTRQKAATPALAS